VVLYSEVDARLGCSPPSPLVPFFWSFYMRPLDRRVRGTGNYARQEYLGFCVGFCDLYKGERSVTFRASV